MTSSSPPCPVSRRLEGKVGFITGGATGIGECVARYLVAHGAKVVIADIQDELGQSVVESIGNENAMYIHCDVTKEEDVRGGVDETVSRFGKLDIMFNNAGIVDKLKPHIQDYDKSDFERVININITGVFLCMKHAARVMAPNRRGTIISMASLGSGIGGVAPHAYTCSKHAVVGLTKNLASELGQYGIRVNCLSPYAMATPLALKHTGLDADAIEQMFNSVSNLKGTTLRVDDVANAAVFLASDEAKYISGQNLFIDGGLSVINSGIKFNY